MTSIDAPPVSSVSSNCGLIPLLDDADHFVGVAPPPVALGEDLDLTGTGVTRRFDQTSDSGNVDDAVPHHAPIKPKVPGIGQPVVDVEGADAPTGTRDLGLELPVPLHGIGIDGDAEDI